MSEKKPERVMPNIGKQRMILTSMSKCFSLIGSFVDADFNGELSSEEAVNRIQVVVNDIQDKIDNIRTLLDREREQK